MDVAPWIADWIMMVSDGILWYSVLTMLKMLIMLIMLTIKLTIKCIFALCTLKASRMQCDLMHGNMPILLTVGSDFNTAWPCGGGLRLFLGENHCFDHTTSVLRGWKAFAVYVKPSDFNGLDFFVQNWTHS